MERVYCLFLKDGSYIRVQGDEDYLNTALSSLEYCNNPAIDVIEMGETAVDYREQSKANGGRTG